MSLLMYLQMKRYRTFLIIPLSLIIGFGIFMIYGHSVNSIGAHAHRVKILLKTYITETGVFPENQSDLEKNKVLKIITQKNKPTFLVRSTKFDPAKADEPSGWKKAGFKLELFSLSYGIDR